MTTDARFSERLRELRTARGMSLRDLAAQAYIAKSTISDLENGIKAPSPATATALDRALEAGGKLAELVPARPAKPASPATVPRSARLARDVAAYLLESGFAEQVADRVTERLQLAEPRTEHPRGWWPGAAGD